MKSKTILQLCFLCTGLACTGCYNLYVRDGTQKTATVQIRITGQNGRALATADAVSQIQSYVVSITGGIQPPSPASFNAGESIVFSNVYLAPDYTVTVTAHNTVKTAQSPATVLGSGSASFSVTTLNAQVFVIVPVGTITPGIGRGNIQLQILFPVSENIRTVTAVLTGAARVNATVTAAPASAPYDSVIISTPAIQSGEYIMQLVFDRGPGNSKTSINEAVIVYDNAVTNRWIVDSSGNYASIREYGGIFTNTYSYLSNILFNITSATAVPGTDPSFTSLRGFVSYKLTDPVSYVIRVSTPQFQFLPIPGQSGQAISYSWTTAAQTSVWTVLDVSDMTAAPPSVTAAPGTLSIRVTAADMVAESIYTFTFIRDFTLTYDANGASSGTPPTAVVYKLGDIPQAAENTGSLRKPNMIFNGWNTRQDGSGITYFPGSTLPPISGDLTLYSQWNASSLVFTVTSVNPATAALAFNLPDQTPTISKKDNPFNGQLTVNLTQTGVTYLAGATQWSYTTGLVTAPITIAQSCNNAVNRDTGLVWSPSPTMANGDYVFSVEAAIITNGVSIPCTGYFKVTVVD